MFNPSIAFCGCLLIALRLGVAVSLSQKGFDAAEVSHDDDHEQSSTGAIHRAVDHGAIDHRTSHLSSPSRLSDKTSVSAEETDTTTTGKIGSHNLLPRSGSKSESYSITFSRGNSATSHDAVPHDNRETLDPARIARLGAFSEPVPKASGISIWSGHAPGYRKWSERPNGIGQDAATHDGEHPPGSAQRKTDIIQPPFLKTDSRHRPPSSVDERLDEAWRVAPPDYYQIAQSGPKRFIIFGSF